MRLSKWKLWQIWYLRLYFLRGGWKVLSKFLELFLVLLCWLLLFSIALFWSVVLITLNLFFYRIVLCGLFTCTIFSYICLGITLVKNYSVTNCSGESVVLISLALRAASDILFTFFSPCFVNAVNISSYFIAK